MAKADHEFTVSTTPYTAFQVLGAAMVHCGVTPFRQEGWTLKGQEGMGLFKMGYPVTVTATVSDHPQGSHVQLHGENMGWGLNKTYVRRLLNRLAEAVTTAAASAPPMPAAMAEAFGGAVPPPATAASTPLPDDPNLPPRVG